MLRTGVLPDAALRVLIQAARGVKLIANPFMQ